MKSIERILAIIIIIGILIFTFIKKPEILTVIKEIPGDTVLIKVKIPYDSLIYVFDTITKTNWLHDTAFLPTDTVFIVEDYNKVISYDSIAIQDDSSMTIWANAKVTQNRLYDFNAFTQNNRKTTIINNYQTKNYIGIGAIVGVGITAPVVSYQFQKHEFGVGYNFNSDNSGIIFKYEYKIPFKKR